MADDDERTTRITELTERAEGYFNDAEFREDRDLQLVRYLQATASTLFAIAIQNEMIIELLTKQQGYDALSRT